MRSQVDIFSYIFFMKFVDLRPMFVEVVARAGADHPRTLRLGGWAGGGKRPHHGVKELHW